MRFIDEITVHCSATIENVDHGVDYIDELHRKRGFRKQKKSGRYCGYHIVIRLDGTVEHGRLIEEIGAHCPPNSTKIGVCYIGGLDKNGKPKDTRTIEQKVRLIEVIKALKLVIPTITKIKGHRDHSPDLNKNGKVDKWEWMKACPCYDVQHEYRYI
jgi:hypothetical protein